MALDVIPGEFGSQTRGDLKASAEASYRNLQIMKDAGLSPIPVFHQGEDFKHLDRMLLDGENYIGISPGNDQGTHSQQRWLDQCFSILTERATGRPLVSTHGFGTTSHSWLFRYPFTSADSTSWAMAGAHGQIIIPSYKNGKPNYLEKPMRIILSDAPQLGNNFAIPYCALGDLEASYVLHFINQICDRTISDLRYGDCDRYLAAAIYYKKLQEVMDKTEVLFKHSHDSLLMRASQQKSIRGNHVSIVLATTLTNRVKSYALTGANIKNILLSYFELENNDDRFLTYLNTGHYREDAYNPDRPKTQGKWSAAYCNYRRRTLSRHTRNNTSETD